MPVAAAGAFSLPLQLLRLTLADAAAFRTWVGAADQAEALARIHFFGARAPFTLPLAVVDWAEWSMSSHAGGVGNQFQAEGVLEVTLRASVDSGHDDADAGLTHGNDVGAIWNDVAGLAGGAGYLDVRRVTKQDGPYRPELNEEETAGDFYESIWLVEFVSTVDGS